MKCTIFQETKEIKASAMKLISHLIQSPSSASQIKDTLLSMPPAHRQKLQVVCLDVTLGFSVFNAVRFV